MLALGLQGSPRKKGNTEILLAMFMEALAQLGVDTRIVEVCRRHIEPCKEYTVCQKKGYCPIDDDMQHDIYRLLRQADIIIAASPVFFYNVTAQLKALIDRCQTLWARKYMLKLNDPGYRTRRGFVLAVGATSGKQLFDGIHLTAKYFFDAVAAQFSGSLTYRRLEGRGQIKSHPTVREDVNRAVNTLVDGLLQRPKILFACRQNACCSQMAAAFTRMYAGDRLDAISAGSQPTESVNPVMVEVMQEKGIDMAFCAPRPLETAIARHAPEMIITMGCGEQCPVVPGVQRQDWELPDPEGRSNDFMRGVRDAIEAKVRTLIDSYPQLVV
jgi:arsenate reductase